jgi:hypothetical protein
MVCVWGASLCLTLCPSIRHGTFGVVRPISAGPVGARYTHRRRRRKSLTNTLLKPLLWLLPGAWTSVDHA